MPSYPSGMTVSNRALIMLADALRKNRTELGTRWRRLEPGRQALLVLAHLRKGETYADLACGFGVGTTTVYVGDVPRQVSRPDKCPLTCAGLIGWQRTSLLIVIEVGLLVAAAGSSPVNPA